MPCQDSKDLPSFPTSGLGKLISRLEQPTLLREALKTWLIVRKTPDFRTIRTWVKRQDLSAKAQARRRDPEESLFMIHPAFRSAIHPSPPKIAKVLSDLCLTPEQDDRSKQTIHRLFMQLAQEGRNVNTMYNSELGSNIREAFSQVTLPEPCLTHPDRTCHCHSQFSKL